MSTDTSFITRSHEENWLPVLELAVEEVFEIMVASRVKPTQTEHKPSGEITAMIGLAGALCGILTVRCSTKTAEEIAKKMLGGTTNSAQEVADALGEICNMIAGNFESGAAQMKSASEAAFDRIASMLRERNYRLRIEGHTDDVPIHNSHFESNWELSTSRATEIVRLLIVREGFAAARLSAAGYAEYHPAASNRTAEGRGINRRVDIVILGAWAPEAAEIEAEAQTAMQTPTVNNIANPARPLLLGPPKLANVSGGGDVAKEHLQQ
jgi:outer membrane protein OmpA-like peptidoglycan-associated protein